MLIILYCSIISLFLFLYLCLFLSVSVFLSVSANSGQVNRTGSSDSLSAGSSPARTGQKKAHARSPIPDGNSTDVTSDRGD